MVNTVLHGRRALITGASGGIGADFARNLAARGCHLILVARREELLQALRQELSSQYEVDVEVIPMDLTTPDAPQTLYERVKAEGSAVDVLINNAGFGLYGKFADITWEREKNMLDLNIITLVHMTKLFAKDMVERDYGFILQLASLFAYQPTPLYASYGAAKSFVLHFGEAVNYELRRTNVKCTVLAPGITATEFLKVSGQQATLYQRLVMMESKEVARIGIEAMLKGKPSVVPGWRNAVMAWSSRLVPRRLATAVTFRLMR